MYSAFCNIRNLTILFHVALPISLLYEFSITIVKRVNNRFLQIFYL